MTILDNYMFRPLLAIFRLSLRGLKVLLYNVCARDGEISTSGFRRASRTDETRSATTQKDIRPPRGKTGVGGKHTNTGNISKQ